MEKVENPGRDRILARIRSALSTAAPLPQPHETGQIFAAIPDPLQRFQRECDINRTECFLTSDIAAGASVVSEILATVPPGEVFLQDAPLIRGMAAAWMGTRNFRWSTEGPPREESRATITLAEALVAATGSVFVSTECGGRGGSMIAPVHIVVATFNQIAPSLETALQWLSARGTIERSSMVTLVTGPSRTGDIEKIIVLGAHGPQRLVVVLALCHDELSPSG